MLCQKCHKNLATIRYAEVVDGQVTDQRLCPGCLARLQHDAAMGFELSGPSPSLRTGTTERVVREVVQKQHKCPSCGAPLRGVLDGGKVGCSACYEHFGGQIEAVLEGVHRGLQHKGKVPHLDDARARLRTDLQTKRALLRSVLKAENYEEAARLRDEIQCLETGLYVSESGAD